MKSVNGRTHFDRSTRPNSFHCVKCLYVNLGLSVTRIEQFTRKDKGLICKWMKPFKRKERNKQGRVYIAKMAQNKLKPERHLLDDLLRQMRQMKRMDDETRWTCHFFTSWKASQNYKSNPALQAKHKAKAKAQWLSKRHSAEWRAKRYTTYRAWVKQNPNKARLWQRTKGRTYLKHRRKTDPAFRAMLNVRKRLKDFMRGKILTNQSELVGCTLGFFREHIASKFAKGMSWDNYGEQWVIDHIIPLSKFDCTIKAEQLKASHYTNLQPLTWEDNEAKGDKVLPTQPELVIAILPIRNAICHMPLPI